MDFGQWDHDPTFTRETLASVIAEYYRVLKKGGAAIVFYDLWKITELKEDMEAVKFKQIRLIEWLKSNPVPINSKRTYLSNAREIAVSCVKDGGSTFNSEYDNGVYTYPICHEKGRFHPTQKPLKFMKALILKHSKVGDVVLDSFAGSGTTLVAAKETGRLGIGCELDTDFYTKTALRLYKGET
jgi:DNA modification methylase